MTATPVVTYSSTGSEVAFPITFPYIAKGDVQMYVNGALIGPANLTSAAIAAIPTPYPPGTRITFQRETSQDPDVSFAGGPLRSVDLNLVVKQSLFLVQEQVAVLRRTLRAMPGFVMPELPFNYAASIPEFDNLGRPQVLPTDDLIEELLHRGVLGDGQIWPSTGGPFVASAPGTTLVLDAPVQEAWLFPLFRNGVQQRPGIDYTLGSDLVTLTIVGDYGTGDKFWGYRAGGLNAQVLQRGCTSPEANWLRTDGSDWSPAFARAISTGKRIVGDPTQVYGLQTPLSLVGNADFQDCFWRDLAPTATGHATRKLIFYSDTGRARFVRCGVDRNGDGSNGSLGSAAGMWVENASVVMIEDLEVTGNGYGAGLHLNACLSGSVTRANIHDMTAGTPTTATPGDGNDAVIGLWATASIGVDLDKVHVTNMLTQCSSYGPENINTRGICLGGTGASNRGNQISVTNCLVVNVDEAYDYTGDQWVSGILTTNCRAEYNRKFGFKCSGTVLNSTFTNCYSYRATLTGFYCQGGSTDPQTQQIRYIGCTAEDAGYNVDTYYHGYDTYGFRCDYGSEDTTHPRNVTFEECHAKGYGSMRFGFGNSINSSGAIYIANDRNKIIRCSSEGHTVLAQNGFVDGYSVLGREEDQTIPTGVDTKVSFDRTHGSFDGLGLLPPAIPGDPAEARPAKTDLVFLYDARISVTCCMPFNLDTLTTPPHGVGIRALFGKLTKHIEGSPVVLTIGAGRDIRTANQETETTPMWTTIFSVNAGDILQIFVNQDSGTDVEINGGDLYLYVVDLDSPPQIIEFIPTT